MEATKIVRITLSARGVNPATRTEILALAKETGVAGEDWLTYKRWRSVDTVGNFFAAVYVNPTDEYWTNGEGHREH